MKFPESHDWSRHDERRRGYPSKDRTDTNWIYEHYADTELFYSDYAFAKQVIRDHSGIESVRTYIGLGSGLGRQIAVAIQTFDTIEHIVSVDSHTELHPSILTMGIPIEQKRMPIIDALERLATEHPAGTFDMIAVENCETHDLMRTQERSLAALSHLVAPHGSFMIIGDVYSLLYADKSYQYAAHAPGFTTIDVHSLPTWAQHKYLTQLWIRNE